MVSLKFRQAAGARCCDDYIRQGAFLRQKAGCQNEDLPPGRREFPTMMRQLRLLFVYSNGLVDDAIKAWPALRIPASVRSAPGLQKR